MKVKLLTTMAGPNGVKKIGEILECSEAEAKDFISGGFAIPLEVLSNLSNIKSSIPLDPVEEKKAETAKIENTDTELKKVETTSKNKNGKNK